MNPILQQFNHCTTVQVLFCLVSFPIKTPPSKLGKLQLHFHEAEMLFSKSPLELSLLLPSSSVILA